MLSRRIISSFLCLLVLLNTMGYYFIMTGWEFKHDVKISRALDDDQYDLSKVVTIRIPIALPYQYDNPEFVRVEGKFVHEGASYRLIKQKYAGDTLTVICMKDERDRQIQAIKADIAGAFTDTQTDAPSMKMKGIFIKEYLRAQTSLRTGATGWTLDLLAGIVSRALLPAHTLRVVQPPEW